MRVLIVEDSVTVAAYVASVLGTAQDMEVLPVASDAATGVQSVLTLQPDVVLMDVKLPDHDGVWAIEEIMAQAPCPIVVLSGQLSATERDITFEALRAGAVDVMAKPSTMGGVSRSRFEQDLVARVRLMASAVVVRRDRRLAADAAAAPRHELGDTDRLGSLTNVVIGASTGGPQLLFRILSALPHPFPLPVTVAQHTLEGFDGPLATWLGQTGHKVRVALDGPHAQPGEVLLAPSDRLLRVDHGGLSTEFCEPDSGARSVDALLESAARVWGAGCCSILLTGMGRDGARGMLAMHRAGALTIAQDPESCVVASMPEAAIGNGSVTRVLRPQKITWLLEQIAAAVARQPAVAGSDIGRWEGRR